MHSVLWLLSVAIFNNMQQEEKKKKNLEKHDFPEVIIKDVFSSRLCSYPSRRSNFLDLLHVIENTFDRKRIYANLIENTFDRNRI